MPIGPAEQVPLHLSSYRYSCLSSFISFPAQGKINKKTREYFNIVEYIYYKDKKAYGYTYFYQLV